MATNENDDRDTGVEARIDELKQRTTSCRHTRRCHATVIATCRGRMQVHNHRTMGIDFSVTLFDA